MPKVSVIIPNYNHAPYLRRRIDSVMNQSYTDFEVILLDDCSTDNSAEILYSYKNHPKVSHVVLNSKNSGSPFKQWARGFELAKGEFIWIAESDDWCEPTLLETLVEPMLRDEFIVLSYCQSLLVSEEGKVIYYTTNNKFEETLSGTDFVAESMFGDTSIVNAGMVIFRKNVLAKIENKYLSMQSAGDWMFWVETALQGQVYISAKTLNFCFRHAATVTSQAEISGRNILEGNDVFRYVLKAVNPNDNLIKNALSLRINLYFNQRESYKSSETDQLVIQEILHLHPFAKKLYRRIMNRRYISFIKKFIIK